MRPAPLAALLLLIGTAQAASPRDSLLRHVPDDFGFCAVFTGLPAVAERLRESPFATPLSKVVAGGKDLEEVRKAVEFARKLLGVEWKELADIVPGEAFAFAYKPGPPGKPEMEEGLFLLRSKDGKALAALVARLNLLQRASIEEAEHEGVKYIRRSEGGGRSFYRISGPVMLFSVQEVMLKRAIEKELSLKKDAVPVVVKRLTELGMEAAPAAVVLNPRAFDAQLAAGTAKEAKTLTACWKGLDAIGLSLALDKDAALSLAFVGHTEKIPAACRRFLDAPAKASALWGAFPEKPLLAVAGRIDLPALYAAVCEFMPNASREALEKELENYLGTPARKDVVKELLPALGPDWGACLLAPPAGSKEAHPRLLAAIKLAGPQEMEEALKRVVVWGENLAVVGYNAKQPKERRARIKLLGEGREQISFVEAEKGLPIGLRPAWAMKGGHIVAATRPEAVAAFRLGAAPPGGGPVRILRVSFPAWRDFLKSQREPVVEEIIRGEDVKKMDVEARLDVADAALALLESLELTRQDAKSRVTFTLRLKTTDPLRK